MSTLDTRLDRRWLLGCLAIAVVLRLARLGHQSLWIDELISLQLATYANGAEFWRGLLIDIHGPFTSVLLHGWAKLSLDEAWLRLLYAIPGIATVPLAMRFGTDLFGAAAGRGTALLLAVSPYHVWYSQEVRNYSWLILWITAALVLFLRVWDGRAARRDWLLLAGLLALAVLTNFSAAFLLVTLSVLLVVRRPFPRADFLRWVGVLAFVGVVFLPWFVDWYLRIGGGRMFVSAPSPMGVPLRESSGFSITEVPFAIWSFTYGYSLGPSLRALHLDRSLAALAPHLPAIGLGLAAVAVAVAYGAREAVARGRALLVGGLLFVPTALAVFLAARDVKTFHPRYLMASFPAWLAVLALGWSAGGRGRRVSAAVAAVLVGISLTQHYVDPAYAKEDNRAAARLVLERERPGDAIVVIYAFRPFRHYYAGVAGGEAELLHVHKRFLRTDDEMRAHVADAREAGDRIWLVLTRWWDVAPESEIRRIFEESLVESGAWEVPGVKVVLYEERAA